MAVGSCKGGWSTEFCLECLLAEADAEAEREDSSEADTSSESAGDFGFSEVRNERRKRREGRWKGEEDRKDYKG